MTEAPKPHPIFALVRENSHKTALYLHVVSFKPLPNTTEEQIAEIIAQFNKLYDLCGGSSAGILSAFAGKNIDNRKGFVLVEVMVFRDREAFLAFHSHPAHTEFAAAMAKLMDVWVISDVNIDGGPINFVPAV